MCPDNVCSASGRQKPCICLWHISQQNTIETVTPYSIAKCTVMLMSTFYLFVSLTWTVHHWGAMHVQLLLY